LSDSYLPIPPPAAAFSQETAGLSHGIVTDDPINAPPGDKLTTPRTVDETDE
jgi:hypothetical protein